MKLVQCSIGTYFGGSVCLLAGACYYWKVSSFANFGLSHLIDLLVLTMSGFSVGFLLGYQVDLYFQERLSEKGLLLRLTTLSAMTALVVLTFAKWIVLEFLKGLCQL